MVRRMQESDQSYSLIETVAHSRAARAIYGLGMVGVLAGCQDIAAIQAGDPNACAQTSGIVMEEAQHIIEANSGCEIDGESIASEDVELHSAIMVPSPEKKDVSLFGGADSGEIQATEPVDTDHCAELDRITPEMWINTEKTEKSIAKIEQDHGVSCKVVGDQIVDKNKPQPAVEVGEPITESIPKDGQAERFREVDPNIESMIAHNSYDLDSLIAADMQSQIPEQHKWAANGVIDVYNLLGVSSVDEFLPGWTVVLKDLGADIHGLTYPEEKIIELNIGNGVEDVNVDVAFMSRVFAHELGHATDVTFMKNRRGEYSALANTEDAPWWPSAYSPDFHTGAGEFAESFAVWLLGVESRAQVGDTVLSDAEAEFIAGLLRDNTDLNISG